MPVYQMFLFPKRQHLIYALSDIDARILKKQSYLAKVMTGPMVYDKSPADIALLEDQLLALQNVRALLETMRQDALVEEELSEYLVPPTP